MTKIQNSKHLHSKKVLFLFLIILLVINFFVIGKIDPVSQSDQGYGFNYYLGKNEQKMIYQRYGWPRIAYNFRNFFQFWLNPPLGKSYRSLYEFFHLDVPPSTLTMNILHFFAFFIFSLVLFWFFRLNFLQVFLIGLSFSIFHEYIAEGIYIDPSFNDLWVNTLGLLTGLLIWVIFFQKHSLRESRQSPKSELQNPKS